MNKELLQQALEALVYKGHGSKARTLKKQSAIAALESAIEQPTPAEYAQGYCEGFNDACKPVQPANAVAYRYRFKNDLQWQYTETLAQATQPCEIQHLYITHYET